MTVHPIRSLADYEAALERAEALMDAAPGTPEADELDVLATLIEHYEDEHHPIPPPDPIEAILFRLDQTGRSPHDLRDILGVHRGRVSEILNRKRRLSLDMIRTLSEALDIPAEILIQTGTASEEERVVWGRRHAVRSRKGAQVRQQIAELREAAPTERGRPLPDVVEMHLRAEKDISPEAAEALSTLFRLAYEQVAGKPGQSEAGNEPQVDNAD